MKHKVKTILKETKEYPGTKSARTTEKDFEAEGLKVYNAIMKIKAVKSLV
ncbi:hypothetical protein ACFL2K_01645 [Candidatus Margulisiibacteriota bacterium]